MEALLIIPTADGEWPLSKVLPEAGSSPVYYVMKGKAPFTKKRQEKARSKKQKEF